MVLKSKSHINILDHISQKLLPLNCEQNTEVYVQWSNFLFMYLLKLYSTSCRTPSAKTCYRHWVQDNMFENLQTEEKSMMHQDSLEPTAIRFTLERFQESARWSGYFLTVFLCIYIYRNPRERLIIFKYFLWNLTDIVLFYSTIFVNGLFLNYTLHLLLYKII